jgi:hypothetical protein
MPVWARITLAFVISVIVGLVVWYVSRSTTATYIVGVLTMAAAIAALFAVSSSQSKGRLTRSRINIRRARNSNITGVIRPAKHDGDIKSDIKVRDIDDGDVTGVRQD